MDGPVDDCCNCGEIRLTEPLCRAGDAGDGAGAGDFRGVDHAVGETVSRGYITSDALLPGVCGTVVERADARLDGSHLLGRIDHGKVGDQTGADPERVQEAVKVLPLVYCEMDPGDGLLFHCNTLHRSDQNHSTQRRTTFICCYNAARNAPYKDSRHPRYSHLEKWLDSRIKEIGARDLATL